LSKSKKFEEINCEIISVDDKQIYNGNNKIWVNDLKGNLLLQITDVRLVGIYSDFIQLIGYHSKNGKCNIYVWIF